MLKEVAKKFIDKLKLLFTPKKYIIFNKDMTYYKLRSIPDRFKCYLLIIKKADLYRNPLPKNFSCDILWLSNSVLPKSTKFLTNTQYTKLEDCDAKYTKNFNYFPRVLLHITNIKNQYKEWNYKKFPINSHFLAIENQNSTVYLSNYTKPYAEKLSLTTRNTHKSSIPFTATNLEHDSIVYRKVNPYIVNQPIVITSPISYLTRKGRSKE